MSREVSGEESTSCVAGMASRHRRRLCLHMLLPAALQRVHNGAARPVEDEHCRSGGGAGRGGEMIRG